MIEITFNDRILPVTSVEELSNELSQSDNIQEFEILGTASQGTSLCMLRSGINAFLMYLRYPGDSGFTSQGNLEVTGDASYKLANGQQDSYPLSWSIEPEECYKAIVYFFVNEGMRPDWIKWHES